MMRPLRKRDLLQKNDAKSSTMLEEENLNLKIYVDRMNNECMELNATLFEEANKMVKDVKKQLSNAKNQLKEKANENELLKYQVATLKVLVGNLVSSISHIHPAPSARNNTMGKRDCNTTNQMNKSKTVKTNRSTPNLNCQTLLCKPHCRKELCEAFLNTYNLENENNKLDRCHAKLTSSSSSSSLPSIINNKTRNNIIFADLNSYTLFMKWVNSDYPIDLPVSILIDLDSISNPPTRKNSDDFDDNNINNDNNNNNDSTNNVDDSLNVETDGLKTVDIEADRMSTITLEEQSDSVLGDDELSSSVVNPNSKHDTLSEKNSIDGFSLSLLNEKKQCHFIDFLYRNDLKPCLNFDNKALLKSIYQALPNMGIEIVPLSITTNSIQILSDSLSAANQNKISYQVGTKTAPLPNDIWCDLLPQYRPAYRMKIQSTDSEDCVCCNISSAARDRIVAVVNLFHYLILIKRETMSTSMFNEIQRSRPSKVNNELLDLEEMLAQKQLNEKRFVQIQRLRFFISLARLGYGLPNLE